MQSPDLPQTRDGTEPVCSQNDPILPEASYVAPIAYGDIVISSDCQMVPYEKERWPDEHKLVFALLT